MQQRSIHPKRKSDWSVWRTLAALVIIGFWIGLAVYGRLQVIHYFPTDSEQEAREFITALLTDPASAQFRDVRDGGKCVIGEVNAKNRMGGYVGYASFYYDTVRKRGAIRPSDQPTITLHDVADHLTASSEYADGFSAC